ncbi:MAG: T9SS type A sorting domain-containing protein [Bacteroidota bacterium]|nr:T9SS type A sorting domain-containing protein [Bacteroidota bacterium]
MQSRRTIIAGFFLLFCSAGAFAQISTNGSGGGNWSASSTWAGGHVPTGSETITIQSTDSLIMDMAVTITGKLINRSANTVRTYDSSKVIFAAGSTYEHAVDKGNIPKATWDSGSTCLFTGIVGSSPSNGNQNFYNVEWNCPNQTANLNLGWKGNIIGGNITVDTTGLGRFYFSAPKSPDGTTPDTARVTIEGDVLIMGGQFATNGTSNTLTTVLVTQKGNISVTGGNFSVSRGSGPNVWWKAGGNFSVSNATIQNSGGTTKMNALEFTGSTAHTFTLEGVTFSGGLTVIVDSGSALAMGTSEITPDNSGSFIVYATGAVATGDPAGVNGAVQCTGERGGGNSFSTEANYTFNGTTAQVTGTSMPTTVNDLTIDNPAGVTLSQATTINGVLHLKAGVFDNTVPFTLGPNGSISREGGNLKVDADAVQPVDAPIPHQFFVAQNYPNPFNPTTNIQYGVPGTSLVSVKVFNLLGQEVATLVNGVQSAGVYTVDFDASSFGSGVYFYRVQAGKSVETKRMIVMK